MARHFPRFPDAKWAHCPNCGGAVTADTSNTCEFCHTVLNDGTRTWILRDIFPSSSSTARELIAEAIAGSDREAKEFPALGSPAHSGGTGALAWMIHSVVTEGDALDDSIREMLQAAGKKYGLSAERIDEILRSAQNGQLDIAQPADPKEARAWLGEMTLAAMLTGGISKSEAALIRAVGTRHGLVSADVNYLMASARTKAFQQSKAQLRVAKREKRQIASDS